MLQLAWIPTSPSPAHIDRRRSLDWWTHGGGLALCSTVTTSRNRESFRRDVRGKRRREQLVVTGKKDVMDADDQWTADEFQAWIDGNMSSNADLKRWILWAARLLKGLPVEPQDLLREAVMRILAGDRKLSRTVPIDVNVFGTMRSIASSWHKRRKRKPEISLEELVKSDEGDAQDPLELLVVPEGAQAVSPEQELAFKQEMNAILELFSDREEAQLVIIGRAEGLKGAALAEAAGVDGGELASVLRLIARRMAGYRRDA